MLPCIIGWSHTKFGKLPSETVESLISTVARQAIEHAGINGEDIDELYLGTFNSGLVEQDFTSSLALNAVPGLRFKPATRVENACATGSAAIFQAVNAIAAGRARFALVIGVEIMNQLSSEQVSKILLKGSYLEETRDLTNGFAGVFARVAERYFQHFGDQSEALAKIAAKNHKNATSNPEAHIQKDLGYAFCRDLSTQNPLVAGSLKRTDCAPISDGAACLVLTDSRTALTMRRAVALRGMKHTTDYLPLSRRQEITDFEGARCAWNGAQAEAGVSNNNLDVLELHDCFTISELIQYEMLGLARRGRGADAIHSGLTEITGDLPVNPSGGLKARGHPIGATGVSMHVNVARQVLGEAAAMQIKGAALGGVFNMGGVAVSNYASILEALR